MAMRCDNCGKGIMTGHNVSHSKRRTRKIFKPNLHKAKVIIGRMSKSMKLCTKCLRLVKTAMKAQLTKPAEVVAEIPQA